MRAKEHILRLPGESDEELKKRRRSEYNRRYREWNYEKYRAIKERYRKRNLHRWRKYVKKYKEKIKKAKELGKEKDADTRRDS